MKEYHSQRELYEDLIPAINVKLARLNRKDIKREDIWNYLREFKWKNSVDLTLGEMVQDIIHTDNLEFIDYVKNKMGDIGGNG